MYLTLVTATLSRGHRYTAHYVLAAWAAKAGLPLDTNLLARLANPAQPMHQASLDSVAALLQQHQVIGKNGHDARLVAAMIVHGIDRLLTFNKADFRGISRSR